MEKVEYSAQKPLNISDTVALVFKIGISLARLVVFMLDLWSQRFLFEKAVITISVMVGFLILLEITIWYRIYGRGISLELNIPGTIGAHIWVLFNLIMIGITIRFDNVDPTFAFFTICLGQLVNYLLTSVGIYQVLSNPLITAKEDFMLVYEPVSDSLVYLFAGLYAGAWLDIIAFSGGAATHFYVLTGLLVGYRILRLFWSNWYKNIAKTFFVE